MSSRAHALTFRCFNTARCFNQGSIVGRKTEQARARTEQHVETVWRMNGGPQWDEWCPPAPVRRGRRTRWQALLMAVEHTDYLRSSEEAVRLQECEGGVQSPERAWASVMVEEVTPLVNFWKYSLMSLWVPRNSRAYKQASYHRPTQADSSVEINTSLHRSLFFQCQR